MLVKEIALKYGCSEDTVSKALALNKIDGHTNAYKKRSKKVCQLDENGKVLNVFESQTEAAKFLISNGNKAAVNTLTTNIGRVVNGKRKTCGGYM